MASYYDAWKKSRGEDDDEDKKKQQATSGESTSTSGNNLVQEENKTSYYETWMKSRGEEISVDKPVEQKVESQPVKEVAKPVVEEKKSLWEKIKDTFQKLTKLTQAPDDGTDSDVDKEARKKIEQSTMKEVSTSEVLKRYQEDPVGYLVDRPYYSSTDKYLVQDKDLSAKEVMDKKLKAYGDYYNSLDEVGKAKLTNPVEGLSDDSYAYIKLNTDNILKETDLEIQTLYSQLETAEGKDARQIKKYIGELEEQKKDLEYIQKGVVENKGFIEGIKEGFTDVKNIPVVGSIVRADEAIDTLRAWRKYENGEELDTREKMLVNRLKSAEIESISDQKDVGYGIASGIATSASLIVEVGLALAIPTPVDAEIALATRGASGVGKVALAGGKLLWEAGKITATTGVPRIIESTATYQAPEMSFDWEENDFDKVGEGYKFSDALLKSIAKEYGNNLIEVGLGSTLDASTTAVQKGIANLVGKEIQATSKNQVITFLRTKGGWNGFLGEFAEEIAQKYYEEGVIDNKEVKFTPEELATIAGSVLVLQGAGEVVGQFGVDQDSMREQIEAEAEANIRATIEQADKRITEDGGTAVQEEVGKQETPVVDVEEEMLKADIAQAEEGLKAEPVKEVKIQEDEVKTDYSQDAKVQEVLRDISLVLDAGARKKVVSKVEGSESANAGTDDYTYGVEGVAIPEFIPEELRSRKYVQKAYDAFLNNTVPQEGTKAWQVYQAILDESKGREGVQMQEPSGVAEKIKSTKGKVLKEVPEIRGVLPEYISKESSNAEVIQLVFDSLRGYKNVSKYLPEDMKEEFNRVRDSIKNEIDAMIIRDGMQEEVDSGMTSKENIATSLMDSVFLEEEEAQYKKENPKQYALDKYIEKVDKKVREAGSYDKYVSQLKREIEDQQRTVDDYKFIFKTALDSDMKRVSKDERYAKELLSMMQKEMEVLKESPLAFYKGEEITDDDLPFRQRELKVLEDKFLDNLNIERMKEFSREWFGDENVEVVKNILRNKKALGMYLNRLIEIKNGQAHVGSTFYHEAVHKAFDLFLTADEKSAMIKEVVKRVGKDNLMKEWNGKTSEEKLRLASYWSSALANYELNLPSVRRAGVGIEDITKRSPEWSGKDNLLKSYADSVGIKPENLYGSSVQYVDAKTGERVIFLVDGEMDAVHAQSLIDGTEFGLAGEQVDGKTWHITALKPSDFENPYTIVEGKFDPRDLPYSKDASQRSKQREYRNQFGITKNAKGMYRSADSQVASVDAMAEEWLAENIIDYINNRNSTTFWGKLKRMVDIFVDRMFRGIDHVKDIEDFYESLISGRLLDRQEKIEAKRIKNFNKYLTSIAGAGTKTDAVYRMEVAKEVKKLTTKILKKLEGKTLVKKQFISDLTKQQDIKQVEKDIINDVLKKFPDQIDVASFQEKVLKELLPLDRVKLYNPRYEGIALKDGMRGSYQDYYEVIYRSPIKVDAGKIHFGFSMGDYFDAEDQGMLEKEDRISDKYFGHVRVEEINKDLRRIIEVQSDLYQKGTIEKEQYKALASVEMGLSKEERTELFDASAKGDRERVEELRMKGKENLEKKRRLEMQKLQQYNDPTAHMRMVREEINKAGIDDIKTLLFPTGETGMMIEGLGGEENRWYYEDENKMQWQLFPDKLEVGKQIKNNEGEVWVVKDILREGEFTAYSARSAEMELENDEVMSDYIQDKGYLKVSSDDIFTWNYKKLFADGKVLDFLRDRAYSEAFDVSGKTNKSNPIYKFYEDTLGKYLKNNYQAESYTDKRGISWWKVNIKPEYAGAVEAFRLDEMVDYGKVADKVRNIRRYRLEEEVSVKLPELITMATELGANIKLQKSFRKAGKAGDFTAMEGGTDSRIRILRTLFEPQGEEVMDGEGNVEKLPETPEQQMDRIHGIEKVLAHEIGHLFDWFGGTENMTLKRGNVLGRIANLRSYTEGQFMDLENKDIRRELKTLTQVWNPFDEASVPKKYKTYRYSAKELYAEALSVFLNKPSLVKEVAPNFYQGFVEYMARKKEVQKEYFAIRDMIKQGSEVQSRVENMKKAQEIARGKRMTIDEEKEAYKKQNKWQEAITGIKMGFVNQYAPYLDKLRKAWKDKKITLSKLEEAEQLMGDLALKGNDAVKYAQDVQDEFFVPISEAGIDIDTVGQILVLERNLGDRLDLANPHGLVYDYAKETYDYVKGQLTPAQWNLLSEKLSWWRDYNFDLVRKGYEAGVYSEQFFNEIATVNKNTYTPFAVVDYIEDNYVTAGVIQAVGTTKGVENPLTTQMLKSLSLMKLTATNGAKQDVVKSLSEIFPDEIVKADAIKDAEGRTIGFKKNPKLERSGYTQLEILEDGKRTAYYMDKYIVSMFESSLNGVGWDIARFVTAPLRMVNRIFKPAVTVMKASFQFYSNPLKDYQRSLTNLTALSGLFDKSNVASRTAKVFKAFTREWIKNLKRSWNYAGGEIDAVTQKMLDMYVLSSNVKYEDIDIGNEKFKFDPVKNRIVYKGGVNWLETLRDWGSTIPVIKHTLVPVYDFYMRAGSTFEVNSKIAGFQYLSDQVGEEKASFYTRRYIGTPDYMQKGKFTPLTNELIVFSNVGIQAITADIDLATRPKTASGYWVSTMFKIVFPKLLMLLGASILRVPIPDPDDPEKKKWVNPYDYLSEYYKSMYMAFPIGYDEESESFMFVKAPSDEVGAVIGNLVWKMATYLQGEGMKVEQLGSAIAGLVPFTTGDNPLLSIMRDWKQYLQGRNPYDDFRGRLAINTSKWDEGGMTRFAEMLKWTTNELGVTNFSTYDKSSDTTLEKTMNLPLLERMFELTNYGLQEREENDKALGKKEKNKTLDGYIESYFAEPSNKKLLDLQEQYVIAVKGERPKGGWSGTEKAEETRLKSEFKREILANSGNAVYKSIAKAGLDNDEKLEIINKQKKQMNDEEFKDFMTQIVRYEVVKGEMFALYAKDKNLSQDLVYKVAKESIPVLSAESNNTLLWELRKVDAMSNDTLYKLAKDGLITSAGYMKYKDLNSTSYEKRYGDKEDTDKKVIKLF